MLHEYPVPVVGSTYICIYNIEIPPLTECVVMLNGSRLYSLISSLKGKRYSAEYYNCSWLAALVEIFT
jgi:hypothetical protein